MIPVPAEVINALCARFEVDPSSLSKLGGGREDSDGIAYAFPGPDGGCVLKILPMPANDPDNLRRVMERLRFVHFLGERGVRIVYPLNGPDGEILAVEDGFAAYQMARAEGSHPRRESWSAEFFARWGQAVGGLHRATQAYPDWLESPQRDSQGLPLLSWRSEWQFFHDVCEDAEVQAQWRTVRARLEALPVSREAFGFTHNDPHIENLVYHAGQITLLDFDVANYHWFISDVAIALQAVLFMQSGGMERPVSDPAAIQAFLTAFWAGYELENRLDPFWREQLNLFICYRRILLFCAMQGWLATVPETRAAWKAMILSEPVVC